MSKDKISDYSETPGNNTDIGGINIAEGMLPSDVNNAIREQMAQLKKFQSGASGESVTFATVRVVTSINDTNGNELFGVTATGSAVNEFTVANAATGNPPTLSATGSDTNIDINITPKGTGEVNLSKVDINGGTIDGTTIGGSSAAAGTFTALTVNSNNISADNSIGFRNRIINGDMRIDQRNAGASVTPTTDAYLVDRWRFQTTQSSKLSFQQNAGSVTPPTGFTNYLGATSLSAYSITTSDIFVISQIIEGFNAADLAWGTASAKTITISFWVRSSLTGTFGGSLGNSAFNRSYPFTYTINSANTWEQKSVTIAGDTSGTWLTNNGIGIRVFFGLGNGSTRTGTAGAWAGAEYWGPNGATSVVGTSGATFYLTGVQLEVGSVATPFERRPYGTELSLCQRYFQTATTGFVGAWTSASQTQIGGRFPVTMRASPTVTLVDTTPIVIELGVAARTGSSSTLTFSATQPDGCDIVIDGFSSATTDKVAILRNGSDTAFTFSSEL